MGPIFRTTFALSITRGGLSQALDRVATALAPTYHALGAQVQRAPVVAADEKLDIAHKAELPRKAIWVYPLVRDFRRQLCG